MNPQRVAIVTGGSKGIGRAVSRKLVCDGFFVVVNYSCDHIAARDSINEINRMAPQDTSYAIAIQADNSDIADVERLFAEVERVYGGVDVLVACAGVHANRSLTVGQTDDSTIERVVGVNLLGTFYLLREASNRMRKGGRIITFSSSAITLAVPQQAIYNACKSAIEVLTSLIAKELAGRGITANSIAPGPTATDLFMRGKTADVVERLREQCPLKRIGQPDDIASVVSFLVSDEGGWINAQTIRVNGGLV